MIETKNILHYTKLRELEAILEAEAKGQVAMRQTKDHFEGIIAFLEKRIPKFIGH